MIVGQRIRERRQALHMSADDLAKRLNKNRATIYRYEKGEIENLPIDLLEPLAKALDTTPQYLMGWTNESDKLVKQEILTVPEKDLTLQEFSEELGMLFNKLNVFKEGKEQIPVVDVINLVAEFFGVAVNEPVGDRMKEGKEKSLDITVNQTKVRHFEEWHKAFKGAPLTDEENAKLIEYGKFLFHLREE